MKRKMLIKIPALQEWAELLTGYGHIQGIDHEGTIVYELEADNEFELGRLSRDVEHELNSFTPACEIISAKQ